MHKIKADKQLIKILISGYLETKLVSFSIYHFLSQKPETLILAFGLRKTNAG